MDPSDLTTTSFGELTRLPSKWVAGVSDAVVIEPRDPPSAMLAGDDAPLAVEGAAVLVPAVRLENADGPIVLD